MSDLDDLVVKGISSALRDLAVKDPVGVRNLLSENETSLARRVVREVRNKLGFGLKNPKNPMRGDRRTGRREA